MTTPFRLHPALDVDALRARYARGGRVRIERFLVDEDAVRLREHLVQRQDWLQVINAGDKLFELDRPTRAGMTNRQRSALDDAVADGARNGFQYRYESIRVPDGRAARAALDSPLADFVRWLSGEEVMAVLRTITGAGDIRYADAQATAYAPGDLLTSHDDAVVGKDRRAAHVFGLTANWRPEWGGLLLFHEADGRIGGQVPAFNSLDLFAVPQLHSVSAVHASAAYRRYSVTGWLRAQAQPD